MANDIYLIDFNDSFTYNIANELNLLGRKVKVIDHSKVFDFLENFKAKETATIIYGPGPGHPRDYKDLFPSIEKLLSNQKIYHVGICLGHQILWAIAGISSKLSNKPQHGQSFLFKIPEWSDTFNTDSFGQEIFVQRYNSLVVDLNDQEIYDTTSADLGDFFQKVKSSYMQGELAFCRYRRGLSMQFHPESVGTSCPKLFFEAIISLPYNDRNGSSRLKN